jgi:ankyrin repeat protein
MRALCELGADINHCMPARWDLETSEYCVVVTNSYILHDYFKGIWCGGVRLVDETRITGLELLVKHGASLSKALHAVGYDDSSIPFIGPLLRAGADIEEQVDKLTPLAMAAHHRSLGVIQALLDAGADVNGTGKGTLFAAIEPLGSHNVPIARTVRVLCDAGADATRLDEHNHTLLSFALTVSRCSAGQYSTRDTVQEVVKAVCEWGANVNYDHRNVSRDVDDGDTPLHIATQWDGSDFHSKCAEILIANDAEVNAQNDAGRTPLHSAALQSDAHLLKVLLKHSAKLDVKDAGGKTALMVAKCPRIIKLLVEHKEQGSKKCVKRRTNGIEFDVDFINNRTDDLHP